MVDDIVPDYDKAYFREPDWSIFVNLLSDRKHLGGLEQG
jgi:hypothetical protein